MGNARNLADLLGTSTKANQVISTSGAITTTGAFTSVGIDDNADATAMTIDSAENVGIGQAPESGYHANWTAVDVGNRGGLAQYKTAGDVTLTYNLYHDGAWKAKENAGSGRYVIGATPYHIWYNGASASADGAVTLTEVMRIHDDGAVTKPKQPCFRASVQNSTGSTVGVQSNLTFNRENIDLNADYDTSNGRFTAPVDGTYYFSHAGLGASGTSGTTHTTGASWHVEFLLNGSRTFFQFYWYAGNTSGGDTQQQYVNSYIDMIITLSAGDYITVQLPDGTDSYYINSNSNATYEPYFQGFLIA